MQETKCARELLRLEQAPEPPGSGRFSYFGGRRMDLLDRIETQLISNRLPLVAVTVAAVPYANTPVVLTLHWHGFVEMRLADVTDANVVAYQSVPSSAPPVNEITDAFDELEN